MAGRRVTLALDSAYATSLSVRRRGVGVPAARRCSTGPRTPEGPCDEFEAVDAKLELDATGVELRFVCEAA